MRKLVNIKSIRESYKLLEDVNELGYDVIKKNASHWTVSKDGKTYDVKKPPGAQNWQCSCPGFKYRGTCKHLAMCDLSEPVRHPMSLIAEFLPTLEQIFKGSTWEIVGSYRRKKSTFKDIDVLVTCDSAEWNTISERLENDPDFVKVVGKTEILRGTYRGYLLDINRVDEEDYFPQLVYRTGSRDFNISMRARAKVFAWGLNEHGLKDAETGEYTRFNSEEELFKLLHIEYEEPKNRESQGVTPTKDIPRVVEYRKTNN